MKKFVSILFVVLITLIMLCACDPTVGDGGGDNGGNEDRRAIELTLEIETLEAQVNEADSSSNLDVLKEWAEVCQLKIDTLKIEGKFEGLDALENRIEVVKKLIEAKRYPKTIISDDEVVELLNWLDENKTWKVGYDMAEMEATYSGPEFIHRHDNDVATFKEEKSTNNATYRWMNKDKTIVEKMMYNGRGRTYSYRCVNIPEVVEECKKLAEASVKADYAENWRDYPVALYTFDEFMGAVNDMGGQSEVTVYTSTFVVPMMRPIWDEEGWSMCTSFNRVTDHVIEFIRNGSYYYAVVGEEGRTEAEAIVHANSGADPKVLNTYEKYSSAIEAIKKADTSGFITYGYATIGKEWWADSTLVNSYATPEFYALVKKAVMFDEYSLKLEMKGDEIKYAYITNSNHCDDAMADAKLMSKGSNNK